MKRKTLTAIVVSISILCFLAPGLAFAQAKKVGGGDITFTPKGAEPVTFKHEHHVNVAKLKCTDCHTKIFPMKKQDLGMTKAMHGQDKFCGVCHNGKKAFSQNNDADCSKCHKKK